MPRSSSAMRVRHLVEEAPVVRDHDAGDVPLQQFFERLDAVDVEMVGRLVEQHAGRASIAKASASAARLRSPPETEAGDASGFTEKRCRNSLSRASRAHSARSSCMFAKSPRSTSDSRRVSAGGSTGSCSTLAMARPGRRCTSPSSSGMLPRARAQQRGLAGAVAADEPDAVAGLDGERGAVEQRCETEREFRVLESNQCHGSTADWRVRARSIRWRR